jgi:hypothetical protein
MEVEHFEMLNATWGSCNSLPHPRLLDAAAMLHTIAAAAAAAATSDG